MAFGKKKTTKKAAKTVQSDEPVDEEKVAEDAPKTMKDVQERVPAVETAVKKLVKPARRFRHPYVKERSRRVMK